MSIFLIGNEEEKKKYGVFLWPYKESLHLWVDTFITPAFCTRCHRQLEGTFAYIDSCQGQVGTLVCNYCGGTINCTDRNPFHHELSMGIGNGKTITLEYAKLYLLHPKIFSQIEKETGYNIYEKGKKVRLPFVIQEICQQIQLPVSKIPQIQIVTDLRFPRMPALVNQWLNVLRYLQIT